ncbi:MAG: DUF4085 family protein [Lachnospiraceae bacterium]|nr:DUF4085 family protein [Lachnospiraceae bacterium]
MKYFTKEWYDLMQRQFSTSGLRRIPDKPYSDGEIKQFYHQQLQEEIERDRKIYDTPPVLLDDSELLRPEVFDPGDWLFVNEETGECIHPETAMEVRDRLKKEHEEAMERFRNRLPFDPTETIECFRMCYRMGVRHAASNYPDWVAETVDKRLLALMMMPESAYQRLKKEEQKNRRAFERINKTAEEELSRQDIPEEIRLRFCFHDANVLELKKVRGDVELFLRRDGYWPEPYLKVIFRGVTKFEREKGLVLRKKVDEDGVGSNCRYLYDELYRTEDGYEVHMLLWTMKELRYVTVRCRDIL